MKEAPTREAPGLRGARVGGLEHSVKREGLRGLNSVCGAGFLRGPWCVGWVRN